MTARTWTLFVIVVSSVALTGVAGAFPISFQAGPAYVVRDGGGRLLATDAVTGAPVIDSEELNETPGIGALFAVNYRMDSWGWQLSGLFLRYENEDTYTSQMGNNLSIQTTPSTTYFLSPGDTFTASLASSLSSIEINTLYNNKKGIEYFAGLHNIYFDETFDFRGQSGAFYQQDDSWEVKNNMFGPHGGAVIDLAKLFGMDSRFKPEIRAGIGVYRNSIDGKFEIMINSVQMIIPRAANTAVTSQSLDLGVNLHYALTDDLSLHAGYRSLYLRNVALGPSQVASTTSYNVQPYYDISTDNVRLHGVNAGVSMRF